MQDFYDIIDVYATQHDFDKSDVLDLWYQGTLGVEELLEAVLEEEGIFGYTQIITRTVRVLGAQSRQDRGKDPWKE